MHDKVTLSNEWLRERYKMKDIKKKSIKVLCNFGKFGLGKSITLGMYDFEVPAQLMVGISKEGEHRPKRSNKKIHCLGKCVRRESDAGYFRN